MVIVVVVNMERGVDSRRILGGHDMLSCMRGSVSGPFGKSGLKNDVCLDGGGSLSGLR